MAVYPSHCKTQSIGPLPILVMFLKCKLIVFFLFPLDLRQLLIFIFPVLYFNLNLKCGDLIALKSLENQIWLLDLIN